jgi:2,4-didehydro-3-deoxy-L-rhamnonate hydrolase
MKLCRFNDDRLGVIEGDEMLDVSAALEVLPAVRWPYPTGDAVCAHWSTIRPAIEAARKVAPRHDLTAVALKSPIANPGKIIGIARNRKSLEAENLNLGTVSANARTDGDPIFMFIKANSALAGPVDGVQLRFPDRRNDPEAELTIVIGKGGTDITRDNALDHVLGYTIGIDMTLRGKESQSSRKSIDSYALIGPCVATIDDISDPDSLGFSLSINGAEIQRSNTSELAFDIRSLIAHASTFYTLHPGDIIMAGTPVGFEPVHVGDTMDVDFESIGSMRIAITAHR